MSERSLFSIVQDYADALRAIETFEKSKGDIRIHITGWQVGEAYEVMRRHLEISLPEAIVLVEQHLKARVAEARQVLEDTERRVLEAKQEAERAKRAAAEVPAEEVEEEEESEPVRVPRRGIVNPARSPRGRR